VGDGQAGYDNPGFDGDLANISEDTANILRLADGRNLAWIECGDPNGTPVMFFHGTPDSRFGALIYHEVARAHGFRLISPDRPGYGLSDYQPQRRFNDWPADVEQLADHLQLPRFSALGVSGGGAHAYAVAKALPDRLYGVVSVCGMAPATEKEKTRLKLFNRLGLLMAKLPKVFCYPFFNSLYNNMAGMDSPAGQKKLNKRLPERDHAPSEQVGVKRCMSLSGKSNRAAGPRGARQEMLLYGAFADTLDLTGISVPVTIMHGEEDVNVPVEIAHRIASQIPHARKLYYPGEVHSFWFHYRDVTMQEIAKQISQT